MSENKVVESNLSTKETVHIHFMGIERAEENLNSQRRVTRSQLYIHSIWHLWRNCLLLLLNDRRKKEKHAQEEKENKKKINIVPPFTFFCLKKYFSLCFRFESNYKWPEDTSRNPLHQS